MGQRWETFLVSDGNDTLILAPADEGGFVVTSPFDAERITEAETLAEAFENAADARQALQQCRQKKS